MNVHNFSTWFIKRGRLTGIGILCALVLGAGIAYFSLILMPGKLLKVVGLSIGLGLMGLGGYSARATALELPPPFTNDPLGWRKAKQSYKQDQGQESKGDDSTS